MFFIDQYAYTNRLRVVHPGHKMGSALATLLIVLASPGPLVPAVVAFLAPGVTILAAGIPARFYLKLMLAPLSFLIAASAMTALTITHGPAGGHKFMSVLGWTLGYTPDGVQLAAKTFVKSLGAVTCLYFLSLTTPLVEVIAVLRRLRTPALVVDLIVLSYRFIFVLMKSAGDIRTSQAARLGYLSLKTSYRSLGLLAANLLARACRRARELFTALSARGYDEEFRVLEVSYPVSWQYLFLAAGLDLALFGLMLSSGGWTP